MGINNKLKRLAGYTTYVAMRGGLSQINSLKLKEWHTLFMKTKDIDMLCMKLLKDKYQKDYIDFIDKNNLGV